LAPLNYDFDEFLAMLRVEKKLPEGYEKIASKMKRRKIFRSISGLK
jgi:hypothetical protein